MRLPWSISPFTAFVRPTAGGKAGKQLESRSEELAHWQIWQLKVKLMMDKLGSNHPLGPGDPEPWD